MKTIKEALAEVANDMDLYTDPAQIEGQRECIVNFLADFYGIPDENVKASLRG